MSKVHLIEYGTPSLKNGKVVVKPVTDRKTSCGRHVTAGSWACTVYGENLKGFKWNIDQGHATCTTCQKRYDEIKAAARELKASA